MTTSLMEQSILRSVKEMLMIIKQDTSYDPVIIIHINSVFATLHQAGIGPEEAFAINGEEETWSQFLEDDKRLASIKSYMYLKVRLLFDPPDSSYVQKSFEEQAKEFEYRNFIVKDNDRGPEQIKDSAGD